MRFAVDFSFGNIKKNMNFHRSTAKKVVFQMIPTHTRQKKEKHENLFIENHKYIFSVVFMNFLYNFPQQFMSYFYIFVYLFCFFFFYVFPCFCRIVKRSFCEWCFYWIINFFGIANIYKKNINKKICICCENKEHRGELL